MWGEGAGVGFRVASRDSCRSGGSAIGLMLETLARVELLLRFHGAGKQNLLVTLTFCGIAVYG